MLCVVMAELPVLLPVAEVAEALLRTLHGPSFICRMVANMPDTFYEGKKDKTLYFHTYLNLLFLTVIYFDYI